MVQRGQCLVIHVMHFRTKWSPTLSSERLSLSSIQSIEESLAFIPQALGALPLFFYFILNGLEQIKQSTIYDGRYVITMRTQTTVSWYMDETSFRYQQS